MSEQEGTPQEDLTAEGEQDTDLVRQLRSALREEKSGRVQLEKRLGEVEKRDTFRELGIDTSKGPGKLFFEHYSGELEPEAVQQAAEEYNIPFGESSSEATGTQVEEESVPAQTTSRDHPDASEHGELANARSGAAQTNALPDDRERAQGRFEELTNAGRTRDEAMAGYFSERLTSAMEARKRGA